MLARLRFIPCIHPCLHILQTPLSMCEQGELDDTTGVELVQGRSAGCVRPMITVKEEKVCGDGGGRGGREASS